ncbi:type II secretion system secretin GspD, partial [Pyxidicoccus fallax]
RDRPPPGIPRPGGGTQAAELFSGEVKISADKGTNSLVIVASAADYKNIVQVIQQLDTPRRQVFVEAVIMEVNLDRNSDFGVNLHSGFSLKTSEGDAPGLIGTNNRGSGLPPSLSLANLAQFGGFLAGLQGPVIPALEKLGLDIPAFGVVLHAMQQSSDVNVLSTPHILTSDNEEAEITVGQNVPFQSGFSPSSLGSTVGGVTGGTGGLNPSILGGLGGLGSLYAPITRQNVELKLTVKPQINDSDYIRLVITEQTEEIASSDPVLGPTTSRRSAKTTVIAKDQETVVIGGIMQDRTLETVTKVPVLGDIPILGHLFRETTRRKTKTNLLLFLTPYIIRGPEDFRVIFERKMKERQQFVEQFYGQVPGYDVAVDFSRKPGPLSRMNQSVLKEQQRAENGGPGAAGERIIAPASPAPAPAARPQA